ncbi:MAG: dTDP-glucose 4,6-dehydratase [Candidatus Omnitrophica bacterium]|nr:dTDP-glucose 4,6-dehydratase [Candidatus Omnitrophota bacterium]
MRVLVTGGLGFIGGNFIRYMLEKYQDIYIVNLDKQTYASSLAHLKDFKAHPRYKFLKGDICNKGVVERAMSGCSVVINFAAETHVDRSIKSAHEFLQTNIFGVYMLLEAARKLKVEKFIQIGTDEVYGSCLRGAFKEGDPLMPNSPYSSSKAAGDLLARSYYKTYGVPVIITRSSNNFGPYQFPEKVIPLFITNLIEGKKVPLYGDGLNVRDWIYVIDNCRGIDLVLNKGRIGEIYNIASNNKLNNIQLTEFILKKMKKTKAAIKYVKDRPGHDRRYSLNTEKIRRLGFKPRYNFQEAMEFTIGWYNENKAWWKSLKKQF